MTDHYTGDPDRRRDALERAAETRATLGPRLGRPPLARTPATAPPRLGRAATVRGLGQRGHPTQDSP